MPAQYTSERFVGRDEAFERLAARLDDAAAWPVADDDRHGHVGRRRHPVPRRGDGPDAGARPADDRPAGRGLVGGVDEPYGAIVRAIGPALRALPDDVLADRLAPAPRRSSASCPTWATGSSRAAPGPATGASPRRERRQARTLESILGVLGPPGRAQPGPAGHRGPPPGRRRDPGARHVPGPDLARPAAGDRGHVPAGRRRARRPVAGGPRRDHVQPAAPDPARPPAARSRRAGRADRGHPGRARLGQPAAPRGRTVGWPAARRRGAPGGPPGAAEQLADRLVRRPRDRPDGDPLGRMPARAPADRAGRAAAGSRCSWRPWPPPTSSARTGRRRARSSGPRAR